MTEPTRDVLHDGSRSSISRGSTSVTGVVRFDIADGERTEHWYLHIRKGDVTVSHEGR